MFILSRSNGRMNLGFKFRAFGVQGCSGLGFRVGLSLFFGMAPLYSVIVSPSSGYTYAALYTRQDL